MPFGREIYSSRTPFLWTDDELRQAVAEGGVVRTDEDRITVTWAPRTPDDTRPWVTPGGSRHPAHRVHPECSHGCPFFGHRSGTHGIIDDRSDEK